MDLIPVDSDPYSRIPQALLEMFFGDRDPACWMICTPSMTDRCSFVALYEPTTEPSDGGSYWSVESVEVAGRVDGSWLSPRELVIERKGLMIGAEAGQCLAEAWNLIVRRTRYPRTEYERQLPCDGVGYLFGAASYHGRVNSPDPGFATDLIRLADLIRAVATVPTDSQDTLMELALAAARELKRKADETPW